MFYILDEQEALEAVNQEMQKPQLVERHLSNNAQHKHDMDTYDIWKKKDSTARGILINPMNNDLAYKYEQYKTTHAM